MSNLTALEFIQENSQATPGLFNQRFSVISSNFEALNSDITLSLPTDSGDTFSVLSHLTVGGRVSVKEHLHIGTVPSEATAAGMTIGVRSDTSDYLYFVDSSAAKSNYVIGSRNRPSWTGIDGLSIWDSSADTLIANFSKQSIRFFQNVVGPVFDVGGALADTYNAATFGTGADSLESRIQSAINQASTDGVARVYLPANMYPYSTSSMSFISTVRMVREGGPWEYHDVVAYGARDDRTTDNTNSIQSVLNIVTEAAGSASELVYIPPLIKWSYQSLSHATNVQILDYSGWDFRHVNWTAQIKFIMKTDNPGDENAHEFQVLAGWHPAIIIDNVSNATAGQLVSNNNLGMGDIVYRRDGTSLWVVGLWPGTLGAEPDNYRIHHYNAAGQAFSVLEINRSRQLSWNYGSPIPAGVGWITQSVTTNGDYNIFRWLSNNSEGISTQFWSSPALGSTGTLLMDERHTTTKDKEWRGADSGLLASLDSKGTYAPSGLSVRGPSNLHTTHLRSTFWIRDGATERGIISFTGDLGHGEGGVVFGGRASQGIEFDTNSTTRWIMASAGHLHPFGNNVFDIGSLATAVRNLYVGTALRTASGSGIVPSLAFSSESSLGWYRSGTSTMALSYGTLSINGPVWASGISIGGTGTLIPAISSISTLCAAFVVQGSSSSFTRVVWAAAQPGDQILVTVQNSGAVSSLSSGLVLHSHCTQAGQVELRLSNVSTLVQNQSSRTYFLTRISPF